MGRSVAVRDAEREILRLTSQYEGSEVSRSIWQVINTIVPFLVLLGLNLYVAQFSVVGSVFLSIFVAAFLVRVFIIQHDCGHGSFFSSQWANHLLGHFCSLFTCIPYLYWRKQHAIHHATNGDLSRRGHGDVDLYTVREYEALTPAAQLWYRVKRNPFFFITLGPAFFLVVINRFAFDKKQTTKLEQWSVWLTDLYLISISVALVYFGGWSLFLLGFFLPAYLASLAGLWLFYIQHQFEDTYWNQSGEWSYVEAALHGSSFYELPKIFQWFSGNIGFHHIHHVRPRIPNYRLEECYRALPELQNVRRIRFWESLPAAFLALWDEDSRRLISFREYRQRKAAQAR